MAYRQNVQVKKLLVLTVPDYQTVSQQSTYRENTLHERVLVRTLSSSGMYLYFWYYYNTIGEHTIATTVQSTGTGSLLVRVLLVRVLLVRVRRPDRDKFYSYKIRSDSCANLLVSKKYYSTRKMATTNHNDLKKDGVTGTSTPGTTNFLALDEIDETFDADASMSSDTSGPPSSSVGSSFPAFSS